MSDVVTAFIAYRTKRAELKKKFREQLEQELEPYLANFGAAVVQEQTSGKSIEEVEHLIGVRNRNLIYSAKRASKGLEPAPSPTTPEAPSEAADAPSEDRLRVVYNASGAAWEVYIDGEWMGALKEGYEPGIFELPDEWALDVDNRLLYREAVRRARAASLKE